MFVCSHSMLKRPFYSISVNRDLQVWRTFLQSYHEVSFWKQPMALQTELQVHLHAVRGTGLGFSGEDGALKGGSQNKWSQE